MPEKMAWWMTMLDGIPNDDSGGTDYLRAQSHAHFTNPIARGASTEDCGAVHHSWGVRR
jgi:hypothetical protein